MMLVSWSGAIVCSRWKRKSRRRRHSTSDKDVDIDANVQYTAPRCSVGRRGIYVCICSCCLRSSPLHTHARCKSSQRTLRPGRGGGVTTLFQKRASESMTDAVISRDRE